MDRNYTFYITLCLVFISNICLAQAPERLLYHSVEANLTYVSLALDSSKNIYTATGYDNPYVYEGESVEKLISNSSNEVLLCKHTSTGNLIWKKRIAVTTGNLTSVGRVEFMAADQAGFTYLSTQGTNGTGFLRVEDDSLPKGSGNMIIQIDPQGELRNVISFSGIRNVVASDSLLFMAMTDATAGNAIKIECFDSSFVNPIWSREGSSNLGIGATANNRSQMAVSPNGQYIAVLSKEGSAGTAQFDGQEILFQTAQGFDEMAVLILDRFGNFLGYRTFFGSESTSGVDEIPGAVAISNDGRVYLSMYTPGATQFAGNSYDNQPGYSSNYSLVIAWDADGNEQWATQLQTTSTTPGIDGLAVSTSGDILFAGTWRGDVDVNGQVLTSGSSERCILAKLNGLTGELMWSLFPASVDNSMKGQRIGVIDDHRFVMSGFSLLPYAFDCLDPVENVNKTQFYLLVDESILGEIQPNFTVSGMLGEVSITNSTLGATDFFWDFGDGTTSTESNPNHTYTQAGTYTITLIASNCLGEAEINQDVSILINSSENIDSKSILLSQDYSHHSLFIQLYVDKGQYQLIDLNGRIISSGSLSSGANRISTDQLSPGVYLLNTTVGQEHEVFRFPILRP